MLSYVTKTSQQGLKPPPEALKPRKSLTDNREESFSLFQCTGTTDLGPVQHRSAYLPPNSFNNNRFQLLKVFECFVVTAVRLLRESDLLLSFVVIVMHVQCTMKSGGISSAGASTGKKPKDHF